MNTEQLQQVESLFSEAIELDDSRIEAFLAKRCGDDDALKRSVMSLIERDRKLESSGFLEQSPISLPLPGEERDQMCGKRLGAFEIVCHIASGGMGDVYLGVRDDAIKQQAAIKLIRAGVGGEKIAQRFRQEMQFLAALGKHPGITSILDAGTTESGQLYIAMEYVDGLTISEYCNTHRLGVRDRLRLFCKVGEAVQFAHQNAVLHRDLKPSNLLITESGQPMLIDFGVAKLIAGESEFTETQTLHQAFTPGYSSPEQVKGQPATTASDVYSLGVILYELLSGRRPHAVEGQSLAKTIQLVCEADPVKPSSAATAVNSADDSGFACLNFKKQLRGDLDRIILKAFDRDVERRYPTVEQFTDDVNRFLAGKPVKAQPDRLSYRATKYVQRNLVGVSIAIGFVSMLVAGMAITSSLAVLANRAAESDREQRLLASRSADAEREQRLIAEKRERTANEVIELFDSMIASADPRKTGDPDYRARDLIDEFARKLESKVVEDPVVEARLLQSLASASIGTGEYRSGTTNIDKAIQLLKENLGPTDIATVDAMFRKGQLDLLGYNLIWAKKNMTNVIALDDPSHNNDARWNAIQFRAYLSLVEIETKLGEADAAKKMLEKAQGKIALLDRTVTREPEHELKRYRNDLLLLQGKLKEALPFAEKEFEKASELYGKDDFQTASVGRTLAQIYMEQERFEEAAQLHENSLHHSRKRLGDQHPETLVRVMDLAIAYFEANRFEDAEPLFREFEATCVTVGRYEGDHFHQVLVEWSSCLGQLGRFEEAEELLHHCHDYFADVKRDDEQTTRMREMIGLQHRVAGRTELADMWAIAAETPTCIEPDNALVEPSGKLTLVASDFLHDAISMKHHSTRWQIRAENGTFEYSPTMDITTTEHLDRLAIPGGVLLPNTKYFWRVAHEGSNRLRSDFSQEQKFQTEGLKYRLKPIDLTAAFNKDVVQSPGDNQEDHFDATKRQLVIDGLQNENTHGVPKDRMIGPHHLGDYDQPNAIQFGRESDPIRVEVPNGRYVSLRFLLASAQLSYLRDGSAMNVTLHYKDGTTEKRHVDCPDWYNKRDYQKPDSGLLPAKIVRHGMDRCFIHGKVNSVNLALFDTQISVDAERELKAVVLHPDESGLANKLSRINVMAITSVAPK